jgi:hypothetical protein
MYGKVDCFSQGLEVYPYWRRRPFCLHTFLPLISIKNPPNHNSVGGKKENARQDFSIPVSWAV